MPFHIIKSDITVMRADAIVNAANNSLLGGGGVDGAIHRAAGPELLEECRKLHGCETGKAKLTGGYNLPAKYVIHTVGPIYQGNSEAELLLRSCYRNCLEIAKENKFETIAFPLISAGAYGYPVDEAMQIAKEEITGFLRENDMDVTLCLYSRAWVTTNSGDKSDIGEYISKNYRPAAFNYGSQAAFQCNSISYDYLDRADSMPCASMPVLQPKAPKKKVNRQTSVLKEAKDSEQPSLHSKKAKAEAEVDLMLGSFLPELDESFSEMLMRKIDEKGIKDSECYFRANVDRRLFSKIRSNRDYRPSKETAVAFAIALELSIKETEEMLRKAGYALSDSFMFDVIVKYYIEKKNYDVFAINETLFEYDQKTI